MYLIDGSGLLHRAYYSYPPMHSPTGAPVNAVYGFSDMLWNLLDKFKEDATHIAVIFDSGGKNFRHEMYPDYKANRKPKDSDLSAQYQGVRDATVAFNIPCLDKKGFEADDIIASYADKAAKLGMVVNIVTADKDFHQLINSGHRDFGITLYDPMNQRDIGRVQTFHKFGVDPTQVVDTQSLAGDAVDNVKGVPSIGLKTAAKLITEFGTLENLYANLHKLDKPKMVKALTEHKESAFLSKKLVTLKRDVELEVKIENLAVRKPNPGLLHTFLTEMNFEGLLRRLENEAFA